MSVLCGNRKVHPEPTHHDSVAQVRECFSVAAPVEPTPVAPVEVSVPKVILDGTYTVVHEHGHTTLRLKTQPLDSKFAPGQQVASYLAGPDEYVGFAFVDKIEGIKVWSRFRSDSRLIEALVSATKGGEDVMVSANCFRCGRELTTPESIAAGFGPICAGKGLRG